MHMPLSVIRISGKIHRVLTAGTLLWAAIWSLEATAFGQARASSLRSGSAAQAQAPRKTQPSANAKALPATRHPVSPATTDNWTDKSGIDNNWNTPGNWDSGLPTAASDVVIPSGPTAPNLNVSPTIGTLTLNSGSLFVEGEPNATSLDITGSSITNNGGQLVLNASNELHYADLNIQSASVTLSGTGVLAMSDFARNAIVANGKTFINESTIQGAGVIAGGLINAGVITGNQPVNSLLIAPNSDSVANSGTLEASSGGTLLLDAGLYSNSGFIEANGGTVLLDGAIISGGQLSTSSGVIEQAFQGAPPTLNGVTLAFGLYQLNSGDLTNLQGAITNNGQIKLTDASGTGTQLFMKGTTTIAGSGVILLNGPKTQITGDGLLNQQMIQGDGVINVNAFTNQGTIDATSTTAPMTVDCPTGTGMCTSPGLIEAESGSTVNLTCTVSPCTLDDTGGMVSGNGGTVALNGGIDVFSGTLITFSGGEVLAHDAILDNLISTAQVNVGDGDIATLKGTYLNNGQFNQIATNCNGGCSMPTVYIEGVVNVMGTGPWNFQGVSGLLPLITGATGQSNTLNNGSTILGAGFIGNAIPGPQITGNPMNFVNTAKGVVSANSSLPLTISMSAGNSFSNQGLLSVAANPGSAASVLTIKGPFKNFKSTTGTLSGGSYNISGTLQFDNANILKNAAKLSLAGQILDQNNANALLNFANNTATGSLTVLPQTFGTNFTSAGPFSNAGKVTITKGVAFVVGGSGMNYNQTGGTTTVDGRLAVPLGGLVNITGGTLQGGGALPAGATITGSVSVGNASTTAATFIIGDSIKKSGLITIANNYTQLATGVMDVQIGGTTPGTQYSQLNITGMAALTGTLNIKLTNSFKPTVGQTFTILNASTGVTGTFSVVNGTPINSNEHFSVSYTPTTVVLTVVSGPASQDQSLRAVR